MSEAGDVELRRARAADAEAVATVYLTSRKEFLPYALLAHSNEEVRAWIAAQSIPSGNVTVAEDKTGIIGMMVTSSDADGVSWIDQLYLLPCAVGNGVGTRLLDLAMETLSSPIRGYTFQRNLAAIRFYERYGFHAIARGDGSDNEEKCADVLFEWKMNTSRTIFLTQDTILAISREVQCENCKTPYDIHLCANDEGFGHAAVLYEDEASRTWFYHSIEEARYLGSAEERIGYLNSIYTQFDPPLEIRHNKIIGRRCPHCGTTEFKATSNGREAYIQAYSIYRESEND